MILRITDESQLDKIGKGAQEQVKKHLAPKPRRGRPEQDAGRKLIKYVDELKILAPWDRREMITVGDYFAHIPNGGARSAIEAAIFKGQGVRAGWPDYTLDIPCGRYHGMRIELKADNGSKPDKDQLEILRRLELAGYYVKVAWGYEEARDAIDTYLAFAK